MTIISILFCIITSFLNSGTNCNSESVNNHLTRSTAAPNSGSRYIFLIETLNYLDYLNDTSYLDLDDVKFYLENDLQIMVPLDDILLIDSEQLSNINGQYGIIIVFDNGCITSYTKVRDSTGESISISNPSTDLYTNCGYSESFIESIYYLRCLVNMNGQSQGACDKVNNGIRISDWPQQDNSDYFEYGNRYLEVINSIDLNCNDEFITWHIEGDGDSIYFQVENNWDKLLTTVLRVGVGSDQELSFTEALNNSIVKAP